MEVNDGMPQLLFFLIIEIGVFTWAIINYTVPINIRKQI